MVFLTSGSLPDVTSIMSFDIISTFKNKSNSKSR
jgi:hypothetical protein